MPLRRAFLVRLGLLTLGGFGVRLLYTLTWARDVPVTGDALTYHEVAARIAAGDGFVRPDIAGIPAPLGTGPTAEHPPLFELMLAALDLAGADSVLAQKCAMCAIGAITVALVGLIARSLAGDRAGLLAAGIGALYPFLWVADGSLMSETPYGALIAATILAALTFLRQPTGPRAAVLGALVGLAALTRGEALLLVALLVAPLVLTRPLALRRRGVLLAIVVTATAVVLAPWLVRNALTFEEPVLISTNSTAVFAGANCSGSYYGPFEGGWRLECYGPLPPGDESMKAAEYRRRGLDYAGDHVTRIPLVVAARIGRVWELFRPEEARLYEFFEGRDHTASRLGLIFYYPLLALAVAGALLLRRRRAELLTLLALPAMVTVTAALVYGITRFRFAAEPALVVLAAIALNAAVARLRRERVSAAPAAAGR